MERVWVLVRKLGGRLPWPLLTVYVATVFLFAVVYWLLPYDFYHPYAKYERNVASHRASIVADLQGGIRHALSRDAGDGIRIKEELAGLSLTVIAEPTIVGRLRSLVVTKGEDSAILELPVEVHIDVMGVHPSSATPGERVEGLQWVLSVTLPESAGDVFARAERWPSELRPHRDQIRQAIRDRLQTIRVPSGFTGRVYAYQQAEAGFPSHHRVGFVSFGRRLYLSAITITTVGYGDIVPLTPRARFLCGLEATIGIVLLGLLVSRWPTRSPRPGSAAPGEQ